MSNQKTGFIVKPNVCVFFLCVYKLRLISFSTVNRAFDLS